MVLRGGTAVFSEAESTAGTRPDQGQRQLPEGCSLPRSHREYGEGSEVFKMKCTQPRDPGRDIMSKTVLNKAEVMKLVKKLNIIAGLSGDDRYMLLGTYFFALYKGNWSMTGLTASKAQNTLVSLISKEGT